MILNNFHKYKNIKKQIFYFFLAVALILIFKAPCLHDPAFWDEVHAYINPLKALYSSFLNVFDVDAMFSHPPGMHVLFYPIIQLFGFEIFFIRLGVLFFTAVFLFFSYKNISHLSNQYVGVAASISTFFQALVFAHSVRYTGDIILAGLSSLFIFLFFKKKYRLCSFVGIVIGFTRETGIAFSFVLFIWGLYDRRTLKSIICPILAPIVGLGCYFIWQWFMVNTILNHVAFRENDFNGFQVESFIKIIKWIFLYQNKSYIFVSSLALILFGIIARRLDLNRYKESSLFFMLTLVAFLIPLSFNKGVLARYFIPIVPYFFLFLYYPLFQVLKKKSFLLLVMIFIFLLKAHHYEFETAGSDSQHGSGVNTMMYRVSLKNLKLVKAYMDNQPNLSSYCSHWPISFIFTDKKYGFYGKEYKHIPCVDFKGSHFFSREHPDVDFYIFSSILMPLKEIQRMSNELDLRLVKKISRGPIYTYIYRVRN